MPVSYARQTVDSPNPLARFSHRRRLRIAVSHATRLLPQDGCLLDYGSGPGTFLEALSQQRPDAELIGYDPYMSASADGHFVATMSEVRANSVSVVTVLETLEHLHEGELDEFVLETRRVLRPDGWLLASVPIMVGPVVLLKEANGVLLHRRRVDYSAKELLHVVLGRRIDRPADIKASHKGFDHRVLDRRLAQDFTREKRWYSPFPRMPFGMNSQVFTLWRPVRP
jgi:SAM-dependent methyltransferase